MAPKITLKLHKKWPKIFLGNFGEIRAKFFRTPKNLPAPTSMISIISSPKVFWQIMRRLRAKKIVLLDPSKTKMVSYSAMKRTSLADGESISNTIWTQSLPHHWTHRWYIWASKIPSLQSKFSLLSNTEYWEGCRLRWNSIWNAQSLERRSSLAYSCVSSGLKLWKGSEILANWDDHPHTQEGSQERTQ